MEAPATVQECSHFFEVKTDLFQGPIDLLLHLVKQNELPIEKISLAQVASQYLSCIETMRFFDLDVAGEYLVIAATLLSLKSSVLLNEPVQLIEDEDGNLVNPHDELLRRLKEAEVYKEGVQALSGRAVLGLDVFANPGTLEGVDAPPVRYKPHDSILLGLAFKKLLSKAENKPLMLIQMEQVSVVDRMMNILGKLQASGSALRFDDLIGSSRNRMEIVASFVALLELCKRQAIEIRQESFDSDIYIGLSGDSAKAPATSEFDEVPGDDDIAADG